MMGSTREHGVGEGSVGSLRDHVVGEGSWGWVMSSWKSILGAEV